MVVIKASAKTLGIFQHTIRHLKASYRVERDLGELPKPVLHKMMKTWSQDVFTTLGVHVHKLGAAPSRDPVLFIGNHISYLDIPLILSQAPIVFVSKKAIERWPIIGAAGRRIHTVFVERESKDSRKLAGQAIAKSIHDYGDSICIFPSGTTTIDEARPWRWGSLAIAREYNIPIQPFRIYYEPLRAAAYIDQDFFPLHLWRLARRGKIDAYIEFHEPLYIANPQAEALQWQHWSSPSQSSWMLNIATDQSQDRLGQTYDRSD